MSQDESLVSQCGYRPVRVRPRTGEQSNGHQTYFIGVPWQIAEAIPGEQKFVPDVDFTTGVLTFTPTAEPEQLLTYSSVMAALAVCEIDLPRANRISRLLRALGQEES
jgi:hypothetical protein